VDLQTGDGEFRATLSEVLARVQPGFRGIESVERLTAGASLETYSVWILVGNGRRRLALRRAIKGVPKASIPWAPTIEAEAHLMIAGRGADIPSPEVQYVFHDEDGLGHGFLMEWLDGETLGHRIVRSDKFASVRPRLAYQCGEILGRIHSINLSATGLESRLQRLSPAQLLEFTIAWYRKFDVARPALEYGVKWLAEHIPATSEFTLVHNDFRNGNFVVSESGIVAVLDWEHALIGDPLRDLGWLCANSWRYGRSDLPVGGFGTYEELFAGYQSITGRRVERAAVRYWEVFGTLWWAVGCLELAAQYHQGLDRSIERLVIGRRISECELDCINLLMPGAQRPSAEAQDGTAECESLDLLDGVRSFLRENIDTAAPDRQVYLARVAANALEIVRRDLLAGPRARRQEGERLQTLLGITGTLDELRLELVRRLQDGRQKLNDPILENHLRCTTAAQIAIDQPKYVSL
jgi:aminoglycoside phosphotransferase (APT) family kinase protein